MKKLLISSILLLIMLGICAFNIKFISGVSNKSIEYIDKMSELNSDSTNDELTNIYIEFEKYWKKESNILSILIYHDPIDEITEKISKLSALIQYKKRNKISESLNIIKAKMISLSEDNSFSLQNLL